MKILGIIVFSIFILIILFLFCTVFIAKKSDEELEKLELEEKGYGSNKTE